jgi:hypothetical protein
MIKIETIVTPDPDAFVKEMIKFQGNYRLIGSGSYGEVFGSKSSNIAYKVGGIEDNFPYLTFVNEVIKESKHNPFFPKIYGVRYIRAKKSGDDEDLFVVAMERLRRLPKKTWREFEPLVVAGLDPECSSDNSKFLDTALSIGFDVKPNSDLKRAIKLLKKIDEEYGDYEIVVFDLHKENFMCRTEWSLHVFVDPFA